jgi:transposase InsO family protein/transposase-like protein
MYAFEEKVSITEAFLESGLTAAAASRRPGWPGRGTLMRWVREVQEGKLPVRVPVPRGSVGKRQRHARYSKETKAEAVRLYEMGRRPANIARLLGIDCSANVRSWWKKAMLGDKLMGDMYKPKPLDGSKEMRPVGSKKELPPEVAALSSAELENACLRAVLADLKVGSFDLLSISNKKKVELGERLRRENGYALREITAFLKISKSSYEYHRARLGKKDKHAATRTWVVTLFWQLKAAFGYRTIWAHLKARGIRVSEKVVRRILREEGLCVCYAPKTKKWSSYAGETPGAPANLVGRDFCAGLPNFLWLTDITEFSLNGYKCYLSPVIDCFDGKVVSWTASKRPDARLVNTMLDIAIATLTPGEQPMIHSDRGAHYRWPGWVTRCDAAGLTRSMSAKGCCPDNSACEGFFGRLKNEFFYNRDWQGVDYDAFASRLGEYIVDYNETRIKKSLGWRSPMQFRQSLGLAA